MSLRIIKTVNFWLFSENTGEKLHEKMNSTVSQQHLHDGRVWCLAKYTRGGMGPDFFSHRGAINRSWTTTPDPCRFLQHSECCREKTISQWSPKPQEVPQQDLGALAGITDGLLRRRNFCPADHVNFYRCFCSRQWGKENLVWVQIWDPPASASQSIRITGMCHYVHLVASTKTAKFSNNHKKWVFWCSVSIHFSACHI